MKHGCDERSPQSRKKSIRPAELEQLGVKMRAMAEAMRSPAEILGELAHTSALAEHTPLLSAGPVVLSPKTERILQWTTQDILNPPPPPSAKPAPTPKSTKLRPREQTLWNIIQTGVKGLKYARAVDDAKLRPTEKMIDDGCPGTYKKAYSDPHWRQKIQDEKSLVTQKANSHRSRR